MTVPDRGIDRPAPPHATLVAVLHPSPDRITPRCPHFGPGPEPQGCGGCSWQHIAYPRQLQLKSAIVDRLLRAALPRVPAVKPTLTAHAADPWGYRQKVHFVFADRVGASGRHRELVIGHYARAARRVVPVRECPVHDERGNQVAFAFLDAFAAAGVRSAHPQGRWSRRQPLAPGVLRSIALRAAIATSELMATLVVADDRDRRLRSATRAVLEREATPSALHLNIHPHGDAFIFGRDTRRIAGLERLREVVAGTSFLISPTAFFQTNTRAAGLLVSLVMEAVPSQAAVLDLYAGTGLFALPLARRGQRVIAVEENRAAVADGEASARLNRIPPASCRFVAQPVEAALDGIASADAVVLDPPRDGCSDRVLRRLFGHIRPKVAVYVSCNPEALARDLAEAVRNGYSIRDVQPVDMFPHTAHVETVVTLTAPASPRRSARPR